MDKETNNCRNQDYMYNNLADVVTSMNEGEYINIGHNGGRSSEQHLREESDNN